MSLYDSDSDSDDECLNNCYDNHETDIESSDFIPNAEQIVDVENVNNFNIDVNNTILDTNNKKNELNQIFNTLLNENIETMKYDWIDGSSEEETIENNNILKKIENIILMNVLMESTNGYNNAHKIFKIKHEEILKYFKKVDLTEFENYECYLYYYEPFKKVFCRQKYRVLNEYYKINNDTKNTKFKFTTSLFNKCTEVLNKKNNAKIIIDGKEHRFMKKQFEIENDRDTVDIYCIVKECN